MTTHKRYQTVTSPGPGSYELATVKETSPHGYIADPYRYGWEDDATPGPGEYQTTTSQGFNRPTFGQ